ncbi:PUA domain-containing protein [Natronoarchaeum mannanilyticum]|uniref:PUA domain-containing protein n=1 Tax=Natronoarchaeum mannanilyticum TaxID=926360 RepID=A0AAV3T5D9_9EURY
MTDDSGAGGLGDDGDDLRRVADYQFGGGAGALLFPEDDEYEVKRSSSGRPSQVLADEQSSSSPRSASPREDADGGRLVTLGVDGRFTLGLEGGRRLADLAHPKNRVVVGDDSEPFVREGKNAFAKFVTEVDPEIRPDDEVLVVHEEGRLLAVGRAELSADAMLDFDAGMAVKVRDGAGDK